MARSVYRPDHPQANENGMVPIELAYDASNSSAPHIIRDEMDPTRHMADGKMYTSKAKFRAATRAHGCVEVGNETSYVLKPRTPVQLDRRKRRDDIRRAIAELRR